MNALLLPGVNALEKFSFARKFQLLALLFILPLAYAAWSIGDNYLGKLEVVDGEHSGVLQLQALDRVEQLLIRQRNLTARWKSTERNREASAETQAAIARLQQSESELDQALEALQKVLASEGASEQAQAALRTLQGERAGLSAQALGSVGWWPDAYDRFSQALQRLGALREQIATESGLILDPWLETYLLMQLATQDSPRLQQRLGVLASVGQGAVAAGQFSLQSRLQLREIRAAAGESRQQLGKLGERLKDELPKSLSSWNQTYAQSLAGLDEWLQQLDQKMYGDGGIQLDVAAFEQGMDGAQQHIETLQRATLEALDSRLGQYRAMALRALIVTLGAFGLMVLLALYALVCLQASIRGSSWRITSLAQSLRDGDLRRHVTVHGKDELALIGAALNDAVAQMRDSLQGVNRESAELGDTVVTLSGQAQSALRAVEQQQQQVSQIAAAATQMAATAQSVAENCEMAAQDATQTRHIAEQSNQRSQQTTASMRQLTARLGATAAALSELREQAQQIDRVVDVIKGIAEQTNLLALNAAIEAARAGEQGRGFAVVADEVRSLSQRTQESTREISATVEALQRVVLQAVELMQVACGQAEVDAGSVTELGEHLGEIAGAVQRVSDMIAQIATAVEQQAATAEEVSGNIQQVDQAAASLLHGAQAVHGVADRLSQGSRALAQNTAHFHLD
ncbi:methyl-accepting chemotaxis protein [Pseudomonas sp. Gutcm_11s]|uniref:methyl-accepting chemotaxis protein n=1 Tax=Pseudomonas sp. Gutcm_11s TaxID=3026088 RepID=UPI00235F3196|nr:methyl-accepting chemotaxis protein [Pseudomonas sp. Gutcm_11s]MDD0845232.1 methyl-accepting chemotaxis protein [Pseudomonas sp. Gutcm_11s]